MARRVSFAVPAILRRVVPAVFIAVIAALGGSAVGDPATAYAAPREWDIGTYDWCAEGALEEYQGGKSTFQDYHDDMKVCCVSTGGVWNGDDCVAPPVEQAGAAERQPAPPAITLPEVEATLFMPTPVGPVGPPPDEVGQAP